MAESTFISKIEYACHKKEALFSDSKVKYAIRSLFAGAFLSLTTGAGAVMADVLNQINPLLGRFVFPFIFAWGLIYILFLNAELTTSNMMYLTAGVFLKKIKWDKAIIILIYCTIFNLIGSIIIGFLYDQSSALNHLTSHSFIVEIAEHKLTRSNGLVLTEAIIANVFVNIAILSYLLIKDSTAKMFIVISAIYMFVFLANEHIAANFATFSLVKLNPVSHQLAFMNNWNILRHWAVTFVGNYIGGGILIGFAYAFLNKKEKNYVD